MTEEVTTESPSLDNSTVDTTTDVTTMDASTDTTTDTPNYDYVPEKFLEDGNPNFEKLATSYSALEKKLGNAAALPPSDIDGYEYSGEIELDAEMSASFRKEALEKGMTQDQYSWIMDKYSNMMSEAASTGNTPQSTATTLKDQWGVDYETNLQAANNALNTYLPDGTNIQDYPELANHPLFAQIMSSIGNELSEDSSIQAHPTSTGGYSKLEIEAMMREPDYYTNKTKNQIVTKWFEQNS